MGRVGWYLCRVYIGSRVIIGLHENDTVVKQVNSGQPEHNPLSNGLHNLDTVDTHAFLLVFSSLSTI
ncbi:hypothetical protein AQUCO_05300112v1 [Aquilegia coerulea]|uniref:Uncharacterized protein n=1 Tax=Aquilegia coerulea TaxID=218851 RepID=A0A2G5CIH5_AQUCA|nr:hypothetical protein AQUCO_05300112v1 [Aquilegia coerulea]